MFSPGPIATRFLSTPPRFYEGRKGTKSEHAAKIAEAAAAAAAEGEAEAVVNTQPPATVVNRAAVGAAGPVDEGLDEACMGEAGEGGGSSKGETAASPLGSGAARAGISLVGGGALGEGTGTDGDEYDSPLLESCGAGGHTSMLDYYLSGPDSGPLEKWNTGGVRGSHAMRPVARAVMHAPGQCTTTSRR